MQTPSEVDVPPSRLISGALAIAQAAFHDRVGPVVSSPGLGLEDFLLATAERGVLASEDRQAAGIAYGSACMGLTPLLAVSSTGLGRISEVLGAAVASELALVVLVFSRPGPGGGNDAPSQTDFTLVTRSPAPGGARVPVFAPATAAEAVELYRHAVGWAERERTPVILLVDGMIARTEEGVSEAVLEGDLEALPEKNSWRRAVRLPRAEVRGAARQPKEVAEALSHRLVSKSRTWEGKGAAEISFAEDAELLLVAYGGVGRILRTVVEKSRKRGYRVGLFRPKSLRPFPGQALQDLLSGGCSRVFVVELSEGQLSYEVRSWVPTSTEVFFHGRTGGAVPTPFEVLHRVREILPRPEGGNS